MSVGNFGGPKGLRSSGLTKILVFLLVAQFALPVHGGMLESGLGLPVPKALNQPVSCAATLSDFIDQVGKTLMDKAGFWERRKLAKQLPLLKAEIEKEVRYQCPDLSNCSEDKLREIVVAAIERTMADLPSYRGVLKTIAIFIASATVVSSAVWGVRKSFDPDTAFIISNNLSMWTNMLLVAVGAPILTPLAAWLTKWAWGNRGKRKKAEKVKSLAMRVFEDTYENAAQLLTSTATAGRGSFRNALGGVYQGFTLATVTAFGLRGGPDAAANKAAFDVLIPDLIAKVLSEIRDHYLEVDITNRAFTDLTRWFMKVTEVMGFVNRDTVGAFIDKVIEALHKYDPDCKAHLPIYRRVLSYWFSWADIQRLPDLPPIVESEGDYTI